MNKEDIIARTPVYSSEGIDQLVLTPEGKATLMLRKRPRIVKKPIYLLDDKGEKIPFTDGEGNIVVDTNGVIQYIIKDFIDEQVGWDSNEEVLSATEPFTVDVSTSNISAKAVLFLTQTYWRYNYFLTFQSETSEDYSLYLHKLRNDALSVLNSSKSFNSSTVQAIKTFINKVDSREFIDAPGEEKKQGGLLSLFTGQKPAQRKPPEHKAAFQ